MAPETRAGAINQGTKLRNSCDACAAAKIKCTQEKPSCAYCAKRLKVCVYGASKRVRRTGRPHTRGTRENGSTGTATCTTATAAATTAAPCLPSPMPTAPELSGSCSAVGSVSGTEMAMTPFQSFVPTSPLLGQDWPDFLASLMSPGTTISSTEPSNSAEWFNLDASFDSFPCLDESTLGFSLSLTGHDPSNTTSRKIPVGPTATREGTTTSGNSDVLDSLTKSNGGHSMDISPFLTDAQAEERSVSPVSPPGNLSSVRRSADRRPSTAVPPFAQCHCFTRILRYLAQLSLDSPQTWVTSENGDASTKYPNFEHVYDQIEKMSDEMVKVLQCSCSRESDVVILLSLVISKIQAWYVAAVNAVISDESEAESSDSGDANSAALPPRLVLPTLGTDLDGDESEGEDQRRIFIQHVLSRLTGLQILISRLSQHSANAEPESGLSSTHNSTARGPLHSVVEGKILVMPFSPTLLRALSSDLRDRLCTMSRAIAEKLRVA